MIIVMGQALKGQSQARPGMWKPGLGPGLDPSGKDEPKHWQASNFYSIKGLGPSKKIKPKPGSSLSPSQNIKPEP